MAVLMRDHPGWVETAGGSHRVVEHDGVAWHLEWDIAAGRLTATVIGPGSANRPVVDRTALPVVDASALKSLPAAFTALGPVWRVRTSSLWEAIGTAIIRQVIRAGQARLMYSRLCRAHGRPVETAHGALHLFPDPQLFLSLPSAAFGDLGMAFKRAPLMAAAAAYLEHGAIWARLPSRELVEALQAVPRIGPWTAGAAVADHTGDFGCYPYADLAVRTWARRADPTTDWPLDEPSFATRWKSATGTALPLFTLLTLAWGDAHVREALSEPATSDGRAGP